MKPLMWLIAASLVLAVLFQAAPALSEPIAIAQYGRATVILTDEPCELDNVSNFRLRATWTTTAGETEGCWGLHQNTEIVSIYLKDRRVVAIPGHLFKEPTLL